MKTNDPYTCPRCSENIPQDHTALPDYEGWQCPDGTNVWCWHKEGRTEYMLGTRSACVRKNKCL